MLFPVLAALIVPAASAEAPVLAYLFTLRRARHPMPHVWANYFKGCRPGSFRIHIHVDPTFNSTAVEDVGPARAYFSQLHVLPSDQLMKVRRFGHELVRARMKLLRYAMSVGPTPLYASFYSESCAPISSCAATHAYLLNASKASTHKSFIEDKRPRPPEQIADSPTWKEEFAKVCPRCASVGLPSRDFRYSPGWVTLWHEHAAMLLAKEAVYDEAFATWGWSKLINGIPDESYWSSLLQHFGAPITGTLTTYMEPGDARTGHSKMFTEHDVSYLWSQPAPAFFARKFLPTPRMDAALASRVVVATQSAVGTAESHLVTHVPSSQGKVLGGKGQGGKGQGARWQRDEKRAEGHNS